MRSLDYFRSILYEAPIRTLLFIRQKKEKGTKVSGELVH